MSQPLEPSANTLPVDRRLIRTYWDFFAMFCYTGLNSVFVLQGFGRSNAVKQKHLDIPTYRLLHGGEAFMVIAGLIEQLSFDVQNTARADWAYRLLRCSYDDISRKYRRLGVDRYRLMVRSTP